MPQQKIGKYEVLDRIGRGGMGTIFKGHDPVLNRAVALKVISTDIEVTDELRARFYREAQACARLSHPNIVTVYDMGEDDGRLYIVMEYLEGEELRHVITQRKALALDDKLAIMVEVCDGLHYAHQKGVVHRDVKPSNIMLLRNGHVKLLDFGIAQIAAAESDLTRTGLIMGTIRYISPEQVRGRADHRSDIFSVGAVFYEFLSFRLPFTGKDPMQVLEQLRTEDPLPLTELDPTIPPELAAIVERAMRKDPAERFQDLAKMRAELEVVQRGFAEALQQVRGRVRRQLVQIRELRAALSERIGRPTDEVAIPVLDERARLGAMQALEREAVGAIDALRVKIARADSFAPAFQRGTELLEAEQFVDAIMEFEAIVAEMPEHARALDALEKARGRAEEHRRQQHAAELIRNARAALDEGGYALCLEILEQAAEIPPSAEAALEIDRLRQAAGEARLRERVRAEEAGDRAAQGRRTAAAAEAEPHAPAIWNEAVAKSAEAQAALAQEQYAKAAETFAAATALYHQAENQAREARRRLRERARAEEAGDRAAQGQRSAAAAEAERHVSAIWNEALAKSAEAHAALAQEQYGRAAETFDAATALYGQAESQAREARRRLRERARAEEAGDRAAQGQRSAAAAEAERNAPAIWNEAVAKSAEAQAVLAQEQYAKAAETFDAATALYRQAESGARDARLAQRDRVEQARLILAESRRSALAADATSKAPSDWKEAEASAASGEAAFAREAYTEASRAFDQGVTLYGRAEEHAREAIRALETARGDAEKERQAAALARRAASDAHASKYAAESLKAGESTEAQASAAFSRQEYASASSAFAEARRQYTAAAQMASVAADAEARRVDAMMRDARRLLESGDAAACLRQLAAVVVLRPSHPAAEELRQKADQSQVAAARSAEPTDQDETTVVPTVLVEPPTELLKTPAAPPVAAEPRTVMVDASDAPTVFAESQARPRKWPDVEPARKIPDATVLGPAIPRDAAVLAGSVELRPRRAAPRVGDIGSRRDHPRRLLKTGAFAVGGLATAAIAIFYLLPSSSPPVSPPVKVVTPTPQPVPPRPAQEVAPPPQIVPPTVSPPPQQAAPPQSAAPPVAVARPGAPPVEPVKERDSQSKQQAKREAEDREAQAKRDAEAQTRREAEVREAQAKRDAEAQVRREAAVREAQAKRDAEAQARREAAVREAQAKRDAEAQVRREAAVTEAQAKRDAEAQAKREAEAREAQAKREAEAQAKREAEAREAQAKREAEAQAKRETEAREAQTRIANLRSESEQSLNRMAAWRDQALKAEADRLAKNLFDAARTKHAEADQLASRQDFAAANRAYQEAAGKYSEATLRAQFVREARAQADDAKARMLAEKQRARQDSPDFKAALAEEKQGAALYEQLDFRQAAERFRAAETLFTTAQEQGQLKQPNPAPRRSRPAGPG
jgi:hypothetical protein